MSFHFFATAIPGAEQALAQELARLPGLGPGKPLPGGVELEGELEALLRMNLWLRTAGRVLVRLGEFRAADFAALERECRALPWERFVRPGRVLKVHATAHRCRLYHTGAVEERVVRAAAERVASRGPPGATDPEPLFVNARGNDDRWEVSVDSSGELLHRRGYRGPAGSAPMRETLAAAALILAGFDPREPFLDPMCGSGTFPIEACSISMRRPPGLERHFELERFPGFDPALLEHFLAEARAGMLPRPQAAVQGFDQKEGTLRAARRNAERAGLLPFLSLERADFLRMEAPAPRGLVAMNPPYGRRIGSPAELGRLYEGIGKVLRARFRGWRAAVLTSEPTLAERIGLPPAREHPLVNGGLKVRLYVYEL